MKKLVLISILFVAFKSQAQTSLLTQDTLAVNNNFKQRVKSATILAVQQLASDTTQKSYILSYCNQIINNPDGGWISAITYQVVANPVINYNSPDGDIQFTVNSNIDKVARAYSNILPTPPDTGTASIKKENIYTANR